MKRQPQKLFVRDNTGRMYRNFMKKNNCKWLSLSQNQTYQSEKLGVQVYIHVVYKISQKLVKSK